MSKKAESRALVAAKNRLAAVEDRLLRMQVEGLKIAEKHRDEKLDAHRQGWEDARDHAKRQIAREIVEANLRSWETLDPILNNAVAVAEASDGQGSFSSVRIPVSGLKALAGAVRHLLD